MLFTAFLTAYYTFRLYFEVFEGPEVIPAPPAGGHGHDTVDEHLVHDSHHGQAAKDAAHGAIKDHGHGAHHAPHNHEPAVMMIPLIVLAIGAVFAGWLNFPERARSLGGFLGNSPSVAQAFDTAVRADHGDVDPAPFGQIQLVEHQEPKILEQTHSLHLTMMIISGIIAILGVYLAYVLHLKRRQDAERIAGEFRPLTRLLEAKYYIDDIYQNGLVEPLRTFGRFLFGVDRFGVDGLVSTFSFIPQAIGFVLKIFTQRGYLQGYAVTMLLGVAVILWFVFS
jgi:NADH-quinone oxidoreductase subunit L